MVVDRIARTLLSRDKRLGRHGGGMVRMTAIVGMIVDMHMVGIMPPRTMHIVVERVIVGCWTRNAHKMMVARHFPTECGAWTAGAEPQIGCSTIDVPVGKQVDTLQVDGHKYLIACIGIKTVQPYLIERRTYLLRPHLVDDTICGQLVFVTAINHQFVLPIKVGNSSCRLIVGKIEDVVGSGT